MKAKILGGGIDGIPYTGEGQVVQRDKPSIVRRDDADLHHPSRGVAGTGLHGLGAAAGSSIDLAPRVFRGAAGEQVCGADLSRLDDRLSRTGHDARQHDDYIDTAPRDLGVTPLSPSRIVRSLEDQGYGGLSSTRRSVDSSLTQAYRQHHDYNAERVLDPYRVAVGDALLRSQASTSHEPLRRYAEPVRRSYASSSTVSSMPLATPAQGSTFPVLGQALFPPMQGLATFPGTSRYLPPVDYRLFQGRAAGYPALSVVSAAAFPSPGGMFYPPVGHPGMLGSYVPSSPLSSALMPPLSPLVPGASPMPAYGVQAGMFPSGMPRAPGHMPGLGFPGPFAAGAQGQMHLAHANGGASYAPPLAHGVATQPEGSVSAAPDGSCAMPATANPPMESYSLPPNSAMTVSSWAPPVTVPSMGVAQAPNSVASATPASQVQPPTTWGAVPTTGGFGSMAAPPMSMDMAGAWPVLPSTTFAGNLSASAYGGMGPQMSMGGAGLRQGLGASVDPTALQKFSPSFGPTFGPMPPTVPGSFAVPGPTFRVV